MLTGSFAANFYTVPRMTRDADIVIKIQKSQVSKVIQLFHKEFYIDKNAILDAIDTQSMFNAIHNDSIFKIDFIICKDSSYRQVEFERRRQIECHGQLIWIVAPEDLILSKLEWAKDSLSTIQLKDVKNLLTSIKTLDLSYIDFWIQKLELQNVYKKVLING